MGISRQRYSLDTSLFEANPDRNYEWAQLLYLSRVPGDRKRVVTYFNRPFPLGVNIHRAELHLWSLDVPETGNALLGVAALTERPYLSTVTWNTEGAAVLKAIHVETVPVTGPHEWVIDVSAPMQSVSDGAEWLGLKLVLDEGSDPDEVTFYGSGGTGWRHDYRPMLVVEWSDAPDKPTQLHPADGLVVREPAPWLRWDYTDVSGNEMMDSLQVQFDETHDGFATPLWDSGEVSSSMPELDLQRADLSPAFPGIPDGGSLWWRVRSRDGAGLWSEWSDPVEVLHDSGGTFTLISPAPGGTVADPASLDDATPVISWSLTGATQHAYRVRVWLNALPARPLWDSGVVASSATAVTVPEDVLKWDDRLYRVEVEVWDGLTRASTPGGMAAYREVTRALLDWDATLDPTDAIAARALDPYPMVELTWSRTTAPDGWTIVRNGEVLAHLDYADTVQPDGTHLWVDRYAPPRTELRYTARAVVNGKTAWGNEPALCVSEPVGIWLVNADDEVCIIGQDDGTWTMGEKSAIFEPVTGDRVVQVRTGMRGWEGSISGLLMGDVRGLEGISASDWRDAFLRVKRDGGATLTASTVSIPVFMSEAAPAPTPDVVETYAVEFSFWQKGRYDWSAL